jgi:hypothetical protein
MHTFQEVEKPVGNQVLPLLWVFTYKFDTDGYVTKFKTRICVRGDLQKASKEDNYATTLASKTLPFAFSVVSSPPSTLKLLSLMLSTPSYTAT